jgi:RNA polymerase primary sigma factor
LSPRIELVDQWMEQLVGYAEEMRQRIQGTNQAGRSAADRAHRTQQVKALRQLMLELLTTPEELDTLLTVLKCRRARYRQARRELAEGNLRLVVAVAKKYRGHGLSLGDLIQEGNAGLMRAVDKFDHRLGFKFGTYATWWVRQGVTRALSDLGRTVRVPSHQIELLRTIERLQGELALQQERQPTTEEIAALLGISVEEVRGLLAAGHQPLSLDQTVTHQDQDTFEDLLADTEDTSASQMMDQTLLKERIADLLRTLPVRDREVLELRFGLLDGVPHSLDEVAQNYGVSRERIRQIELRGLEKLRQPQFSQRLVGFVSTS